MIHSGNVGLCLQTRDWNEELQTTRELPRKNLPERLLRERAIFKVYMNLSGRVPFYVMLLYVFRFLSIPS